MSEYHTFSYYNGVFYKQKGAASGSPVSPIVADLYMEHFEEEEEKKRREEKRREEKRREEKRREEKRREEKRREEKRREEKHLTPHTSG